ncbi:MAG: 3-phosphoshikimate 1-carboxyvinyltransferase [Ignavibacteriaceae bacterium]|nr:3-phosphoshikimate 1-carboxyvinyltransferase [Ignavibacteriaceae bacterium]
MNQKFDYIEKVNGNLELPGDKSISHRAVMFSSMSKGESKIYNLSSGEDVKSTRKCFESLGVVFKDEADCLRVNGCGFKGFKAPEVSLDAGNSGTTARLISGVLCAQNFSARITGDESLSARPMERVITPLKLMGANIESNNGKLPLLINPSDQLKAIEYQLSVASAQVKSSILLAGIHLDDYTSVIEKEITRDHTERMLGLKVTRENEKKIISVSMGNYPEPKEYFIPSDISTASFFIVLALFKASPSIRIKNLSLNPTRTGMIAILKQMGAQIEIENMTNYMNEPAGDVVVRKSYLKNVKIDESIIPNIIDEIPVLAVAGLFAEGEFRISGASELRKKESDRIRSIINNLILTGIDVEEYHDGFAFEGKIKPMSFVFQSFNDHRIAMAFAVLSSLNQQGGEVSNFDCVSISNPEFLNQLSSIKS